MPLLPNNKLYNECIKDPTRCFDVPDDVVIDSRLTSKQKSKILDSWEHDQKLLLTAEEENMLEETHGGKARASKVLQDIHDAREQLR